MFYRRMTRIASIFVLLSLLLPGFSTAVQAETTAVTDDEIIYIDGAGFIRIIDPNVAPGTEAIDWVSPEGGWFDFAVGDFNNDGDMEIAAIGNGKLVVYDPVVRSEAVIPDGVTANNVPWARLFEMPIPGTPNLIGAGNMDQNVAGDEIIFGYSANEGNNINYRMTVIKKTDAEGRAWTTHVTSGYAAPWKFVVVGNVNNVGSDDIVRGRDIDNRIEAVEIDNNFNRIFERASAGPFLYESAAIGNFVPGGLNEVAATRTFQGTDTNPSLLVFTFVNNVWGQAEGFSTNFFPHPRYVFAADINGNGVDELFWLRELPANVGTGPRLYRVPRTGDGLPAFQSRLDEDNGYTRGAGGDTNGDGREEVVIMRNNKILMFNSPETGDTTTNTREWNVTTNGRSLVLANVDGTGYQAGARFAASRESVSVSLEAGTLSQAVLQIEVTNAGSGGNIPLTVVKESNVPWVSFSVSNATTPASIYLSGFTATQLAPGVYTERLRITSSAENVLNQPFYIPISLTVTEAKFSLSASNMSFVFRPDETAAKAQNIAVNGLPGLVFSAALLPKPEFQAAVAALGETPRFGFISEEGDVVLSNTIGEEYRIEVSEVTEVSAAANSWPSVEWATLESDRNTAPATITVTVQPEDVPNSVQRAVLVVIGDQRAGTYPENIKIAEVTVLKDVTAIINLPFISR
jgi:hypothetical protein